MYLLRTANSRRCMASGNDKRLKQYDDQRNLYPTLIIRRYPQIQNFEIRTRGGLSHVSRIRRRSETAINLDDCGPRSSSRRYGFQLLKASCTVRRRRRSRCAFFSVAVGGCSRRRGRSKV